ncbi:hypothetical protein [Vreelandella neptunia]|uniref:Uncharacterized protein n=1 Tax=Vreelandella neptunia TaxID=115551 RepID=A0ABS9S4T7_9GAMM|nr:hypothetical protein [Halomonas neptunia]MCH4811090.1 hypothetical protein [Halomonas neptunia]
MQHGVISNNARYTPQRTSQCLLLGCFLILLFGAIEQFHKPHFAVFQQSDENLLRQSTHYSVAPLPTKLRIKKDSSKWQTDNELLPLFELSVSNALPPNVYDTLLLALSYGPILNRVAPSQPCSCLTLLPPNRAPPNIAAS